ncbi:PHD finger protein 6-like, partial [Saccostrea cucullata]|uniref:PHD finger protein 6-like n=1 Tax=Saccostrea cuccullata TaxID=36930 RepID=UPI002ED68ADA
MTKPALMQYSADLVQYKFASFGGFKIDKVEKEIQRGKRLKCSICKSDKSRLGKVQGATAGCAISKCSKTFHFYCARLDDVAITKRMDARYLKKKSSVVMYRVFCGEAHYNQFK